MTNQALDEFYQETPEDDVKLPVNKHEAYFTDINDVEDDEPDWVVESLLPVGLTFLAGPPKSLKSTWALDCAVRVALGQPGLFRVPFQGAVRVWSAEATANVIKYCLTKDLNHNLPSYGVFKVCDDVWMFRLDTNRGMRNIFACLNDVCPKLVIIDPLRNFHSGDENDSGLMFKLLSPLREWAITNSSAVVIVHHLRKPPTKRPGEELEPFNPHDMRGTGALFGLADGVLVLTPHETATIINATFKRAASYMKIVQLGVFGKEAKILKVIT